MRNSLRKRIRRLHCITTVIKGLKCKEEKRHNEYCIVVNFDFQAKNLLYAFLMF